MNKFRGAINRSLTIKLSLFTGFIVFISILVMAWQIVEYQKKQLTELVIKEAADLAETVYRSTKWSMLHYQAENIQAVVNTIGRQSDIDNLRIINKEGLIIYSADSTEIGRLVDMKSKACYACHAEDRPLASPPLKSRYGFFKKNGVDLVGMIRPIYNEKSCWIAECHAHPEQKRVLGVLDISISLEYINKISSENSYFIIKAAVAAFLIIIILTGVYAYYFINLPIKLLKRGVEAASRGGRTESIRIKTNDELADVASAFNDMSEKNRLREMALLQSERLAAIGVTVAGVAHNIKNILNGLEGGVYVVNAGLEDDNPENVKRGWEMVQRNVARISDLAYDLLTYAKDRRPLLTHEGLNELILEVVDDASQYASSLNIEIETELDPETGLVWIDRNAIYRALLNLVNNGVDACRDRADEKKAVIVIRTTRLDRHQVEVEVTDNGCGMSGDVKEKIFTTFFSTKGSRGTGLGLLAVKKIIDEHNGRIMVASYPGRGSTFTIYLPDRPPSPDAVKEKEK